MLEKPAAVLGRYRWAVQDPVRQAAALAAIFERVRGRAARTLREDFAGNGADAVAFVGGAAGRRAIAVDVDAQAVAHGRQRAARLLGRRAAAIDWFVADVHAVAPPQVAAAELLSVLNFSIGYLHTRTALLDYFRHARACLAGDGVLVLNTFGGPDALRPGRRSFRVEPGRERGELALAPYDYEWELRRYDAVRNRIDCRIHFAWDDPSATDGRMRIEDAFVYDWRLWSLVELVEALRDVGFRRARAWRHDVVHGRDGPRGWLRPVRTLRDRGQWTAYVVAER
jgi:SAM-dependent methyltransferase